ncbi:histidine phosphatase family protein [Tetragenococcus solitarius]|uniref:Histidine phosphatase family protein n=1 Tax=Tetragenococcus solitarius TaxID=71453 RepID=A0ABN3YEP1_9ENTE|nr:histidine phosphatase family protein [Tetragenococcus solitarius]
MKKKILAGFAAFALLVFGGCAQQSGEQTATSSSSAEKNGEVTIYLTRHGETMFNDLNKVQGWSDTPLTEEGEEVAVDLGKGLAKEDITFQSVYSSDMKRAHDTADAILDGLGQKKGKVQEMVGLREAGSGQFEGESLDTIDKEQAKEAGYDSYGEYEKDKRKAGEDEWSWLANAHYYADQSGYAEGADKVQTRMTDAIDKIAEKQSEKGGGNVLVVSHGMSINIMLADMTDKYKGDSLENASVTKIHYQDGDMEVESIGDTSYLEEGKE